MAMPPKAKKTGIWRNTRNPGGGNPAGDDNLVDRVADFSYQSDALAQMVVDIWLGSFNNLITPENTAAAPIAQGDWMNRSNAAKAVLATRGIYLQQPLVVTENEYILGVSLADANLGSAVVFVVPAPTRPTLAIGGTPPTLLETAKMLMAVTPNGI